MPSALMKPSLIFRSNDGSSSSAARPAPAMRTAPIRPQAAVRTKPLIENPPGHWSVKQLNMLPKGLRRIITLRSGRFCGAFADERFLQEADYPGNDGGVG